MIGRIVEVAEDGRHLAVKRGFMTVSAEGEELGRVPLSGYRIMWMMVMFDLPVGTSEERRAATRFRNFLLDQGFEMAQFSVYMRFCAGKEQVEVHTRRIAENVPDRGKVHLLAFTDKQYENIVCFAGKLREPVRKIPDQLVLF
jgi:CRISPR-associated protein Cas2